MHLWTQVHWGQFCGRRRRHGFSAARLRATGQGAAAGVRAPTYRLVLFYDPSPPGPVYSGLVASPLLWRATQVQRG